jgi:peptide/nickel transport system ATP-binding protein/oligopeptide transport system ATP-binding protein
MRRNVQLIFQDPYASLNPRMTVGQILAEPLALHDVVPPSRRSERSSSFTTSRYPRLTSRSARRCSICCATCSSALGLPTFPFSHDLAVVKHVADRIAVMHLGRIVEIGPSEALFANPRHPYTRALLSAIPLPAPGLKRERIILHGEMPSALHPPGGCAFHPRCPAAIGYCRTARPELTGNVHAAACHRSDELPPANLGVNQWQRSQGLERLVNAFRLTG